MLLPQVWCVPIEAGSPSRRLRVLVKEAAEGWRRPSKLTGKERRHRASQEGRISACYLCSLFDVDCYPPGFFGSLGLSCSTRRVVLSVSNSNHAETRFVRRVLLQYSSSATRKGRRTEEGSKQARATGGGESIRSALVRPMRADLPRKRSVFVYSREWGSVSLNGSWVGV